MFAPNFSKIRGPIFNVQEAVSLAFNSDDRDFRGLRLPYEPLNLIFKQKTINTSSDAEEGFIDAADVKSYFDEIAYFVQLAYYNAGLAIVISLNHPDCGWIVRATCTVDQSGQIVIPEDEHQPYLMRAFFERCLLMTKLLTCKNVFYEDYDPQINTSRQLCRARERKNTTLLKYKILHIKPFKSKANLGQESAPNDRKCLGNHNAFHSVRGHFRTFSAEHPAFGKPWGAGTFWTGPYVCGNPEFGLIWKDYHVEIEVPA